MKQHRVPRSCTLLLSKSLDESKERSRRVENKLNLGGCVLVLLNYAFDEVAAECQFLAGCTTSDPQDAAILPFSNTPSKPSAVRVNVRVMACANAGR